MMLYTNCINYSLALRRIVISLSLCLSWTANARINYDNIRFKQLSIHNQIPNNSVLAITQDHRGYMWFGTRNGLSRYDGYSVTNFLHNAQDSNSIANNSIHDLYSDTKNNLLWAVTEVGISRFDHHNQQFKNFTFKTYARTQRACISSRTNGDIIVARGGMVYQYNPETQLFDDYFKYGNFNTSSKAIFEDQEGIIWIYFNRSLKCYDSNNKKLIPIPMKLRKFQESYLGVTFLDKNQLLFSAKKSLYHYNLTTQTISEIRVDIDAKLQNNLMRCATLDAQGHIWLGTEAGIIVLGKNLKQIAHYQSNDNDNSQLNDNPIYDIFMDHHHNMWAGAYFGGVNYFAYGTDNFTIYPKGHNALSLSGKVVREIIEMPDNSILVGTEDNGINHIDRQGVVLKNSTLKKDIKLKELNIHSLLQSDKNNLWIGHFLGGLINYNPITKQTQEVFNVKTNAITAFDIEEDSNGNIWHVGPEGLHLVVKTNGRLVSEKKSGISAFTIKNLNDSTLLIGSRARGLFSINTTTESISPFAQDILNEKHITAIHTTINGHIVVGTNNDGLFVLNINGQLVSNYGEDILKTTSVKSLCDDSNGDIWAGTDNGLICLDSENKTITRYTMQDGLPINQFNYNSALRSSDGKLYFGTINGLISFDPIKLKKNTPQFGVTITGAWCSNAPVSISIETNPRIRTKEYIKLSHKQAQSLRIEYSGLNYQHHNQTKYAVKIDGMDKDWQYVSNQNQMRISNLSAGTYIVRVKASADGKHWDEEGTAYLRIRVEPPLWLSWWAIILYFVVLILIVMFMIRFTRQRILLRMNLKAEQNLRMNEEILSKQKIHFFTSVSHDLKTPLTLILSPMRKIVKKGCVDQEDIAMLESVYRNAKRMHHLIDELMLFSKIEMQHLSNNMRKGDFMLFVNEIAQSIKPFADEKDIEFEIHTDDTNKEVWFSPTKVDRILTNLFSNAFKYTDLGGCVIFNTKYVQEDDQTFAYISVKDNGRGIAPEMQEKIFESYFQVLKKDHRDGFGLGLSLTKSLVESHKGSIQVVSKEGEGSEFIVRLNLSENAFSDQEKSQEGITDKDLQKYTKFTEEVLDAFHPNGNGKLRADSEEKANKDSLLIVEDNIDMNQYINSIFNGKYIVHRAFNGLEALEVLSHNTPSIIISDVMMPKMDGIELVAKLKSDINTSHIPVILLTAKASEDDFEQGYASGADAYIAKPFNEDHLRLLVENLERTRKSNIDKYKQTDEFNSSIITNNSRDEKFISDLNNIILSNLSEESFGVNNLTDALCISRSALHTKLKHLTGCSTTQYVRMIKMKEAKKQLVEGGSISEVAYNLGIADPSYFTKCFKREFDITPSEFVKGLKSKVEALS